MANPNIYAQYTPPVRSFGEYANEIERGRFLQGQNAIQQAAMAERQQAQAAAQQKQNALTALLSGARTEQEVEDRLLNSGMPDLVTMGQEARKRRVDAGKVTAETADKKFETQNKRVKAYRDLALQLRTPQDAADFLAAFRNDPQLAGSPIASVPLEKAIAQIGQDPQSFARWQQEFALGAEEFIKQNKPQYMTQNLGGTSQITAVPGLGGAPSVVSTSQITQSPDSVASNETTRRGQNMVDQRARERLDFERGTATADAGGPQQAALVKQFGKAPPGYRWKADGTMESVPGGPADIKAGEAGAKKEQRQKAAVDQADRIIQTVDSALGKVGYTTSGAGSVVAGVPGTTARDLKSELETIKANLGFAELQAMREASPTGGALGALAVQELTALQSTIASLDQGQSPAQLEKSLKKIKGHLGKVREAINGGPAADPAAPVQTATNPKTGEKLQLINGQWVPMK